MVTLRRISTLSTTALPALAVLVVGHNLVFLLAYGADFGRDLARTGDGPSWDETVRVVLAAAGLFGAAASWRVAHLVRLLRQLDPDCEAGLIPWRRYGRSLLGLWVRLLALSLVLFVVQENYERWSTGLGMPGLGILGGRVIFELIPVFALVSLVFAAVVALFTLGIETLEAMVARTRARRPIVSPAARRVAPEPIRRAISIIGRNLAGRAPPAAFPA
jgi:hypothetical protein